MKQIPLEGNFFRLDGGAMFGHAPKELWKRWIEVDEKNRIPLAGRALLVQTDKGENILFEAGIGSFFDPVLKERYGICEEENRLLHSLNSVGVKAEEIDLCILSHLHFDHAGGLLSASSEGPLKLLFPKARYVVSGTHWKWALNPPERERASFIPLLHNLLQESNRLVLVDECEGALKKECSLQLQFRFVHGHTQGMMLSLLEESQTAFVSDLVPGKPWLRETIAMGYDRFAELSIREKKSFLKECQERQFTLFFTHDRENLYHRF